MPPQFTRKSLNEWFPTYIRYLGSVLMTALVTASVLGRNDYPSAYIPVAGMILYKWVADGTNGDRKGTGRRADDDHSEKWSGLP